MLLQICAFERDRLYAVDYHNELLVAFALRGQNVTCKKIPVQLAKPTGLAIYKTSLFIIDHDFIHVIDQISQKVINKRKISPGGGRLVVYEDNLYYICGFDLYCESCETIVKKKWRWTAGRWIAEAVQGALLAVDARYVYMCCSHLHQIFALDKRTGKSLFQWGRKGLNDEELHYPASVLAHDGFLYVAEYSRIQVFTPHGKLVQRVGPMNDFSPRGMCVLESRLYVIGFRCVHIFINKS